MDPADGSRGGQNAKASGRGRVYQARRDINITENHTHHFNGRMVTLAGFMAAVVVLAVLAVVLRQHATESAKRDAGKNSPISVPSEWRRIAEQNFDFADGPNGGGEQYNCTSTSSRFDHHRMYLVVDSCRDYTYQVGYEAKPTTVHGDFWFAADVQYISGPADGYCAMLAFWTDNEHYIAFKLGRSVVEVTRDKGGLPHQGLEGPRDDPSIKTNAPNRMAIFFHGGKLDFLINSVQISTQTLNSPEGQTWIGAQAANRSDRVECAFDNVELRVP